jgi:hypothetical protein
MKTELKSIIKEETQNIYKESGQSAVFEYIKGYNNTAGEPIPFEKCKACETFSPSLDHECLVCGQKTTPKKPIFYKAVLKKVKGNVFDKVYPHLSGAEQVTMKERLGNEHGCCSECGHNEWMLLADQSVAVKQGGKPYMECLTCGSQTHL